MKASILKYIFIILISLVSVETFSENTKPVKEHPSSLNSMAAQLVRWYGRLLPPQNNISFSPIDKRLKDSQKQYPHDIEHLKIISSKLANSPKEGLLQFNVTTNIKSKSPTGSDWMTIKEQFLFNEKQDGSMELVQVILKDKTATEEKKVIKNTDRMYFKSREFAYSWLAYMDGIDAVKNTINLENWIENAVYDVQIGSKKITGSVVSSLKQRSVYLSTGKHTLRSIDITQDGQSQNTYILDLTMNWNGFNAKSIPVIAKINQKIKIKLNKDGTWDVLSIKEKHLIPDLTPWQEFLC